jgi:hypothetical protein
MVDTGFAQYRGTPEVAARLKEYPPYTFIKIQEKNKKPRYAYSSPASRTIFVGDEKALKAYPSYLAALQQMEHARRVQQQQQWATMQQALAYGLIAGAAAMSQQPAYQQPVYQPSSHSPPYAGGAGGGGWAGSHARPSYSPPYAGRAGGVTGRFNPQNPLSEYASPTGRYNPSNPLSEYSSPTGSLNPNNPLSEIRSPTGRYNPNNPLSEVSSPTGRLNPNNPLSEVSSPTGIFNPNNPMGQGVHPVYYQGR